MVKMAKNLEGVETETGDGPGAERGNDSTWGYADVGRVLVARFGFVEPCGYDIARTGCLPASVQRPLG